jgi:hypothetical protein
MTLDGNMSIFIFGCGVISICGGLGLFFVKGDWYGAMGWIGLGIYQIKHSFEF